jgi:threonine aldolase
MRQAGVLAAAGLIALEEMPPRLVKDHANATLFAQRVANVPGVHVNMANVQTNIVIVDIAGAGVPASTLSEMLQREGVLMNPVGTSRLRAVTHKDVTREECEMAAGIFANLAASASSRPAAAQ